MGCRVIFPWDDCGLPVGCLWVADGMPMGCPWAVRA